MASGSKLLSRHQEDQGIETQWRGVKVCRNANGRHLLLGATWRHWGMYVPPQSQGNHISVLVKNIMRISLLLRQKQMPQKRYNVTRHNIPQHCHIPHRTARHQNMWEGDLSLETTCHSDSTHLSSGGPPLIVIVLCHSSCYLAYQLFVQRAMYGGTNIFWRVQYLKSQHC